MKEKYTIDARGRSIGRVASEAAGLLLGKNDPAIASNKVSPVEVKIVNVSKLSIDARRAISIAYYKHSGYMGSLKKTSLKELAEKDIQSHMRRTVSHMLPDNKLRKARLENLKIEL